MPAEAEPSDGAGEPLGDALGDVDGEALGEWLGEADGLVEAERLADAEADGLALAWVIVMVVTPFDTVAVTSAPVVPMRKIPAKMPDFAWKNSSRRRSSKVGHLLSRCSNEQALSPVRGAGR